MEKYPLNPTRSPIDYDERLLIMENWTRITSYFNHLQRQINILAGSKEVDELLQSIEDAIQRADELIVQINDAIEDVNEAIVETNTAKDEAIEATNNANQAIENVNRAFEQVNQLTTEVEGLITQLNEKLTEAQVNIEEGNKLNQSLTVLQTSLTQLQTDLQSALAESLTATQNANTAYEAIKGWTGATEWQVDMTYAKNNVVTHNGSTFQSKIDDNVGNMPTVTDDNWIMLAQRGVDGTGSIKSVNGIGPDTEGNVQITIDGTGSVKSVNGIFPDPSGNVQLNVASNWDSIEGKPSTFTPDTHPHAISDVTGLQTELSNKAPVTHNHGIQDIANLQTTLDSKANSREVQHVSQKGQANGYASLDGTGKVPSAQLPDMDVTVVDASTTQKGIVKLNNTLTSSSTTEAATANVVKSLNDSKANKKQDSWLGLSLLNGWSGDLKYYKDDLGNVHLKSNGSLQAGKQNKNSALAQLPTGYYPHFTIHSPMPAYVSNYGFSSSPAQIVPIEIANNGYVYLCDSLNTENTRLSVHCVFNINSLDIY